MIVPVDYGTHLIDALGDKKLCVVGTGGFGRETLLVFIDSIAGSGLNYEDHAVFMVADEDHKESELLRIPVIKQSEFDPELYGVVIGIGDPQVRKKVVNQLPDETTYVSLVHPSVVMSEWVELGEGSVITAGTIITCNIKIGKHAHLNLHTTIGHDCIIGDYFTTAPGAKISGICTFGECVYFGTSACVKQGVTIVDDVVIGMGGVVIKDIEESGVYVGNPLRSLSASF